MSPLTTPTVTNILGFLTGVAFLLVLVRSIWIGVPLSDRAIAIFALLLWGYLQIDISAILPFSLGDRLPLNIEIARGSDDEED